MLKLAPVDFLTIQHWFVDFQKHSKCLELPPENAQYIGIFEDNSLIGYFIIQGYDNTEVEINQGFLLPEYRHLELPVRCTQKLEEMCKRAGYKRMLLGTHNRFKSYLKFAKKLGYTPQHLTFFKEL